MKVKIMHQIFANASIIGENGRKSYYVPTALVVLAPVSVSPQNADPLAVPKS